MPNRPPVHRPPYASDGFKHAKSASQRGYDVTWRKVRAAFLAANPFCVFCQQQGRVTPATQVDHIQEIAVRPDLRFDWNNLRGLCVSHHSSRTIRDLNFRRKQIFG
jgi:5-methylcytosine-specific restriction protein A